MTVLGGVPRVFFFFGLFLFYFTRSITRATKAMWYFLNEIRGPPVHFHLNLFPKSLQRNSSPATMECSF